MSEQLQFGFDAIEPDLFPAVGSGITGGFRGPVVCQVAGITYRQLDYWARTGLVVPSVRPAAGSGSARLYSFTDILVLKLVKRLLEAGITLQNIRVVVDQLRGRDAQELSAVTLLCDGSTVYECVDDDQVIDLLRGGQGVFAVAIGVSISELAVAVAELPAEAAVAAEDPANFGGVDELSRRRARRSA